MKERKSGTCSARVRIPATSANLGPGFDAIGLALQIYNELTLSVSAGPSSEVQIRGEGADELPQDGSHLSLRAANTLFEAAGLTPPCWALKQVNRIPLSAGLGSSAAAIVGGMVAANEFLASPFSREQILELAVQMEGHPDNVAPALYGGLVISCRDGDRLRTYHQTPASGLRALLSVPEITLATSEARRILPEEVLHSDAVFNIGRAAALTATLLAGEEDVLSWAMEDRLHQPYRCPLIPGLEAALAAARRAGSCGAAMSGAGPSIIALWFEREEEDPREASISAAVKSAFAASGIRCRTFSARSDHYGASLLL